jgi:pimeloyl-ACP methyl ester carboxylesterase
MGVDHGSVSALAGCHSERRHTRSTRGRAGPNAQTTREVLPNYDAAQIAGTGHFLMMEKPEEFNRLLTAFLDKIKF